MEHEPYFEIIEIQEWDDDEACPFCYGDGGDPLSDFILECPECEGEGRRMKQRDGDGESNGR